MMHRRLYLFLTPLFAVVPITCHAQFGTITPFAGTSTGTLVGAITNIVNALLALVAVVAVIVIIFSTVTALSGRDDEDIARRARSTIIFALIGLVIVALSAVIINFILRAIP